MSSFYLCFEAGLIVCLLLIIRTLLLSHHGVKQCFHTMDVAASHWATLQMGPAGPTSEKAAKHMKNTAILVAKRCKNWACEARDQVHQRVLLFFSFFLSVWSPSSSRHGH